MEGSGPIFTNSLLVVVNHRLEARRRLWSKNKRCSLFGGYCAPGEEFCKRGFAKFSHGQHFLQIAADRGAPADVAISQERPSVVFWNKNPSARWIKAVALREFRS